MTREIKTLFSISISWFGDRVEVENNKKEKYIVKFKDGSSLDYITYEKICNDRLNFYQLVKRYKLEPVDTGTKKV